LVFISDARRIANGTDQLQQFLVLEDKEGLKRRWDNLAKIVFNSFAE
jgi:hypothetical protein